MTSNLPKQPHYIPKLLLKNFVDSSGRLHVFDKKEGKLHQSTPGKTFVRGNLTRTFNFDTGNYSYEVEQELSRIESRADPVIRRIIECARNNEHPKLSIEDRHAWQEFYHASCRRTPEFAEEMLKLGERFDAVLHLAIERLLSQQGIAPPNRELLDQNPILKGAKPIMMGNIKARFASGDHPHLQADVERFSRETGLLIAVIRQPKRSFVIGSHGVTIVQPEHKRDPAYGGWLPIAHDVILTPTSHPEKELLLPLNGSNDHIIRRINRASFRQSRFIAGRSEALIRSLMTR